MKTPIQTENLAMGIALNLAGVRPWQNKYFVFVVYDEKILKSLKCETVKEALDHGLCGKRICNFDLSDAELYKHLSDVWDDEKTRIEANQDSALSDGVTQEDVVRITARVLAARKQLTEKWQDLPIFLYLGNGTPETETSAEDEILVTHPGFRMVSVRASKATLVRLGLADETPEDEEDEDEEN